MTNTLILVKALDSPPATPHKLQKLKPRRERRREMRDRDRAAKLNAQ
jgi:hypothetical protein